MEAHNKKKRKEDFERERLTLEQDISEKTQHLEYLYNRKKMLKKQAEEEDCRIREERTRFQGLVDLLSADAKERYYNFQTIISNLQAEMEKLQQELERLTEKKIELGRLVVDSELRASAVSMYMELIEAQEKRNAVLKQMRLQESEDDERERLLCEANKEKEETVALEEKIGAASQEIQLLHEDLCETQPRSNNVS